MSLADLHATTKVAVRLLAALEEDRYEELPPLAFTRGFVKSVAWELGLDPAPLLRAVESAMSKAGRRSPQGAPLEVAVIPAARTSSRRRGLAAAAVVMLLLTVAAAYSIYRQMQAFDLPFPAAVTPAAEPLPAPEIPGPAATTPPSSPAATLRAASSPPAGAPPQTAAGSGGTVTVEVSATGRSWIRVVARDTLLYEGFITAGQRRRWQSVGPVTVRVGNAGAVSLSVNGRVLGVVGRSGEVVERTFNGE